MKKIILAILFISCLCRQEAHAKLRLPRLISNGMVLQRDMPLKIWGWGNPGEKVSVSISSNRKKKYITTVDQLGTWMITLAKQKAGGPFTIAIDGQNHLLIEDVLIGDVWLCSGQSNMEQGMGARLKYKYADEIATVNYPQIRHFLVPDNYNFQSPQPDINAGSWKPAVPENISEFTAVGYFFAKELHARYKVPIGLINASWGGSPAEAWISEQSLKKLPDYYQAMQKFKDKKLIDSIESTETAATQAWFKTINEKDEGIWQGWSSAGFNDNDWSETDLPVYQDKKLKFFPAVTWYRKTIDVPASMTGKKAKIELGRITDADSVFINGIFIGNTTYQYPARRYELAPHVLKPGKNTIVIRVQSNSSTHGFTHGKPYELTTVSDTVSLLGRWKHKATSMASRPLPSTTAIRFKPGGLYNAMIFPLINYHIKGAIWYQGETNANNPGNYHSLMQTLISDWRNSWQQPALPFIFVQLPNYKTAISVHQTNSQWAELRHQQLQTSAIENTGMAIAIDLGEGNELHPENKKDVSLRLSLLARKMAYGEKKLVASGPIYQSMKIVGDRIILYFKNTGSGLLSKDGQSLRHFAIAGNDGKYLQANAIIKKNTVEVWNSDIKSPVQVSYAWADNPEAVNLYNKEGLPASPFKTERW